MSAYRAGVSRGLAWPIAARPASWWRRWRAMRDGTLMLWRWRSLGVCQGCRRFIAAWWRYHHRLPPVHCCSVCRPPRMSWFGLEVI